MMRFKFGAVFSLYFLMALVAASCQKPTDAVVATVDGEPILESDLIRAFAYFKPIEDIRHATPESLRKTLDELIERKLILLEARQQNYNENQQIQRELEKIKRLQLYHYALNRLVYEPYFSPDELKRYYRYLRFQRRVRHIFLPLNPIAPERESRKIQATLQRIRRELEKSGDFAKMAEKYSRDRNSAKNGGDLGYISWRARPFDMAVFALPLNQISEPVRTEIGFHLIEVTEERELFVPPYQEAKFLILNYLRRARAKELTGAIDSMAQTLKSRYHYRVIQENVIYVVEKLRAIASRPDPEPVAFIEIFNETDMAQPLVTFDGGRITIRDMGANFHRINSEQQLGFWLETTGRQELFLQEARKRGLDREPYFRYQLQQALEEQLRKEFENMVIEEKASAQLKQQNRTSMRMTEWRRLKREVRKEWIDALKQQYTIHIEESKLNHILSKLL